MSEIGLTKRVKYAGDVHAELLKAGWDLETATRFVNNIPDASIEIGFWERFSDDKFIGYGADGKLKFRKVYTYECSKCGTNTAVRTNYCPCCGAYMRGEV